jgi:malonyl-CoA decarboxylase
MDSEARKSVPAFRYPGWWERVVDSIADRGREMLKLSSDGDTVNRIREQCHALMSSAGRASGIALAREVVRTFETMTPEARLAFYEMLQQEFGPHREAILEAADAYRHTTDDQAQTAFRRLYDLAEPPRQELFRRINQVPHGVAALINMREHLLAALHERPHLHAVDADMKHLFTSWFNPGFLRLRRIDWSTSASVLEALISYESVHAIQGWDDLRRRLEDDRRCFAFFHPALPDQPLIFVEVALVKGAVDTSVQLLSPDLPVLDTSKADTAVFYSINNCLSGLRGIPLGNFLIKQVMYELMTEFPKLNQFITLSPLPKFASNLARTANDKGPFTRARLDLLLAGAGESLCQRADKPDRVDALLALLDGDPAAHADVLEEPLRLLVLAYLTQARHENGRPIDPVANFHLANGANLERINPFADTSPFRMKQSFGAMVNYRYRPNEVEVNHERFMATGEVSMTRNLAKTSRRIAELWDKAGA